MTPRFNSYICHDSRNASRCQADAGGINILIIIIFCAIRHLVPQYFRQHGASIAATRGCSTYVSCRLLPPVTVEFIATSLILTARQTDRFRPHLGDLNLVLAATPHPSPTAVTEEKNAASTSRRRLRPGSGIPLARFQRGNWAAAALSSPLFSRRSRVERRKLPAARLWTTSIRTARRRASSIKERLLAARFVLLRDGFRQLPFVRRGIGIVPTISIDGPYHQTGESQGHTQHADKYQI